MIEIQVTGLVIGLIVGMITGAAIVFYAVWSVDSSHPDQFAAGWNAGREYGQTQAMIGQGDLDEKLLRDMERRGAIQIVKEKKA